MIAAVFHWPPREMDAMGLAELLDWQRRAGQWLSAVTGQGPPPS